MSVERRYQERRSECMAAISTGTLGGRDHGEADWKEKVMFPAQESKSETASNFIYASPRKKFPKALPILARGQRQRQSEQIDRFFVWAKRRPRHLHNVEAGELARLLYKGDVQFSSPRRSPAELGGQHRDTQISLGAREVGLKCV
jgi:hypothetical protein